MTPRLLLAAAALVGALAAPGVAAAQSIAYSTPDGTTNMRAGPGFEYQVVAIIRPGSAVEVYGCLRNFSWCDSVVQGIRGWVSTTRLEFQYGGNLVPFQPYYTYFDAPIVTFDFGYWDRYYYDEPWYRRNHHRRHHRQDYDTQRPRQSDGRPPRYSDGGGDTIQIPPDQGGGSGRQRDYRLRNGGGVTVFPEQGDGTPPARARDSGGNQGGGGGARCRASNPNCR